MSNRKPAQTAEVEENPHLEWWGEKVFLARETYVESDPFLTQLGTMLGNLSTAMSSSSKQPTSDADFAPMTDNAKTMSGELLFIEFCCDEDSEIGIEGSGLGINVVRCTVKDGDLSVPRGKGIKRVLDIIAGHKGPLHCTAHCMHTLDKHSEPESCTTW